MTRVILHLGDHKTGTSTLQRLFAAGHGPTDVLYPLAGRAQGAGHHNLAWEVGNDPRFKPSKGTWSDAWHEIATSQARTALISTEAFEFKRPDRVMATIRRNCPTTVSYVEAVIYVRPHAPRLLSSFAERIKRGIGPYDRDAFLDQALATTRYQFAPRIQRWRAALAPGRLNVRIFSRSKLTGSDVVSDFCTEVLNAPAPTGAAGAANKSPDENGLRMMQMQGAAFAAAGGPGLARAKAPLIRAAGEAFQDGPKPQWTLEQAQRIETACSPDARALDNMFGGSHFSESLDDAVETASACPKIDRHLSATMAEAAIAAARASTVRKAS